MMSARGSAVRERRLTESSRDYGQGFLELLSAMARWDAYRSVLVEVVALAGKAPGLSDEQVRTALVGLGERASRELDGAR